MTRWPSAQRPTRRRFVAIAAAAAGLPFAAIRAGAETAHLHRWSGIALGAAADIMLYDPDAARAKRLTARCVEEIDRLEDVFSLYRPESAISRLNRDGRLAAPPLELVTLLADARIYSERTEGAFDVTVQPLWRLYAAHFARPGADPGGPDEAEHARARALVDYRAVEDCACRSPLSPAGYGDHPQRHRPGLHHGQDRDPAARRRPWATFCSTSAKSGRSAAIPDGRPWHVGLRRAAQPETVARTVTLTDRAVATSAGIASPFDASGRHHHLFDPSTGRPAPVAGQVSVIAPRATMADALSTALAVSPPAQAAAYTARFPKIEVLTDTASQPS